MSLETLVNVQWIVIVLLVLAIVFLATRLEKSLPEGIVKSMLEAVKQPLIATAEQGLARVEAISETTTTPIDNIAAAAARLVLEEIKKGAVNTPLEEK